MHSFVWPLVDLPPAPRKSTEGVEVLFVPQDATGLNAMMQELEAIKAEAE